MFYRESEELLGVEETELRDVVVLEQSGFLKVDNYELISVGRWTQYKCAIGLLYNGQAWTERYIEGRISKERSKGGAGFILNRLQNTAGSDFGGGRVVDR
jgi:hypothetical protein